MMYLKGQGVAQSYSKAIELGTVAANQGNELAVSTLAFMLLSLVKEEGRVDLRADSVYRVKIVLKLPPHHLSEDRRALFLPYIENAKVDFMNEV